MIALTHLFSTLLNYMFPLALLLIGIFFLIFIALPFQKVRSYQKDGVSTCFFPILGFLEYNQQSLESTEDIMGAHRGTTKHMTDPKYMITHVSRLLFFVLQGPQYIKEFLQKQNLYNKAVERVKLIALIGLVGAEGEIWKRHRKIISRSFNLEFLKANISVIQNTRKEFFDKLSDDEMKNYSAISRIQVIMSTFGNLNHFYCVSFY